MLRPLSAAALVRAALPAALALSTASAFADPADYVFVPYTTAGSRVLAYTAGIERDRDGGHVAQQTLSLGWVPTQRWYTALYAAWTSENGAGYAIDEWSWLNHVQLASFAEGAVDVGLLCEIEKPHDRDEGTGFKCGPTLQTDSDDWQANLNPIFEKHTGAADPAPVALGYQWQVKRLLGRGIELGAQGFGDVGTWNHWAPASQQAHVLGPAVFAKWTMPDGHALKLDAAWLVGIGSGSPKDTARVRLRHEF